MIPINHAVVFNFTRGTRRLDDWIPRENTAEINTHRNEQQVNSPLSVTTILTLLLSHSLFLSLPSSSSFPDVFYTETIEPSRLNTRAAEKIAKWGAAGHPDSPVQSETFRTTSN